MIIGLGYRKGSGKDTVADFLVEDFGFVKIHFADALKRGVKEIFGFDNQQLYGSQEEKEAVDTFWGMSPRFVLQHVGTELFRDWIPDIWIKRAFQGMDEHSDYVIADCRFFNEVQAVKNAGGDVWRIDRASLGPVVDEHASEVSLVDYDEWDCILDNDSTLDELRYVTRAAMGYLGRKP